MQRRRFKQIHPFSDLVEEEAKALKGQVRADMIGPSNETSPLRMQINDTLHRARRLSVGASRNDLRQLALGLRWLEKNRLAAKVQNALESPPDK